MRVYRIRLKFDLNTLYIVLVGHLTTKLRKRFYFLIPDSTISQSLTTQNCKLQRHLLPLTSRDLPTIYYTGCHIISGTKRRTKFSHDFYHMKHLKPSSTQKIDFEYILGVYIFIHQVVPPVT